jgi:hypothetical protein
MSLERRANHRYLLDGEEVPSVTTLIRDGVPKPALVAWAARSAAGYAVDNWAELAALSVSERLERINRSWRGERDRAASAGSAVHGFAQRLALGEEVEVPDYLQGYVDAYLRFAREWGVRELLVEAPILNRRYWYAGTLDLVAQLADRQTWILDFKTTASGVFTESALQLAAYRSAEAYVDADGNERPLPAIDAAAVVWLTPTRYELVPVDAGDETFRVFLHACEVADFQRAGRDRYIGEPLASPAESVA